MKFILITCIDPKSANQGEWDTNWPGSANRHIKQYNCGEDELYVVKGQNRFDYDQLGNSIQNKNQSGLDKIFESISIVIESSDVDMQARGALLIHYGGGRITHNKLKVAYNEIRKSVVDFYHDYNGPINHTSNFIITDYSIGADDTFAALVKAFRNNQNEDNLKTIIDYLKENISESKKRGEYLQKTKSLDEIYYMFVPLRLYVDAYLSCKENEKTETEKKIRKLLVEVNKIQCKFNEMQNLFKELTPEQEINSELSEKISNILKNCENTELTG